MSNSNFYLNVKNLNDNGYLTNDNLKNALYQGFINNENYIEFMGSEEAAIDGIKEVQIRKTKDSLSLYLEQHPYHDPISQKDYSVTLEKQALLNNSIAVYQLTKAAGTPKTIKWNATGEECVEFTEEEISALAIGMAAYVEPMVSYQQAQEVAIRNASTIEDVMAINPDYNSVNILMV